ncbi:hypothetical protein [Caenimonas aquaedulcis]|uniref:DUF1453 domain-containing protein n=1 Tax=Caenimonas aquaedulcis TaxID=2793270 RepID=A0A931MHL9_9BURK|nr:hypothetical protein [Caenimonas aquaedulcis]MBG9388310.1 hypothetical protein [Caenimonas aquaedulcis]
MTPHDTTTVTLLALMPLLVWRMIVRVKRMVGRQRAGRIRPWVTLVIFPLVLALFSFLAKDHAQRLWWLAGGVACGLGLAVWGLKKTVFEATPTGLFYTPNAHLGIALSLLLVGRLVWRMVEVFTMDAAAMQQPDEFTRSPLTLLVFGLLAGYYIGYAFGLVRWRFAVMRAKRRRESP